MGTEEVVQSRFGRVVETSLRFNATRLHPLMFIVCFFSIIVQRSQNTCKHWNGSVWLRYSQGENSTYLQEDLGRGGMPEWSKTGQSRRDYFFLFIPE